VVFFFVYYSGHGVTDGATTHIYSPDDELIPIENQLRSFSNSANSLFIGILDCCRKLMKCIPTVPKQPGQLYLLHCAAPDKAAIAQDDGSLVTKSFLNYVRNNSTKPFPDCMVGWDKGIAEIVDNLSQKVNEANKVYLFRSMLSSKNDQVSSSQFAMSDAKDSSTLHEKETEILKKEMEAINSVIQENHVLKKEMEQMKSVNHVLKKEMEEMKSVIQEIHVLKKENHVLKKENDMLKKNSETVQSAND